jgi:transcriptional regulator with XRE-family HTH domain
MPVSLEEILAEMPPERRTRIANRAAEIESEINLRELRRLRKLTQARLSKKLKIGQEGISRMEKRTDLYISTLRSYVEGVGGKLSLVVEFPDQPPVILAGLGLGEEKTKKNLRRKAEIETKSKPGSKPESGTKARRSA